MSGAKRHGAVDLAALLLSAECISKGESRSALNFEVGEPAETPKTADLEQYLVLLTRTANYELASVRSEPCFCAKSDSSP